MDATGDSSLSNSPAPVVSDAAMRDLIAPFLTSSENPETWWYYDMFCGMGAFPTSLRDLPLNAKCAGAIDRDFDACQTYLRNHGTKPLHAEIAPGKKSKVPVCDLEAECRRVNEKCGGKGKLGTLGAGFPCPAHSRAGKQGGEADRDAGGHLFDEAVVPAVRWTCPRTILLENVADIVKKNGGAVWARMEREIEAEGYHVTVVERSPTNHGVAQSRGRVYALCRRKDLGAPMPEPPPPPTTAPSFDVRRDVLLSPDEAAGVSDIHEVAPWHAALVHHWSELFMAMRLEGITPPPAFFADVCDNDEVFSGAESTQNQIRKSRDFYAAHNKQLGLDDWLRRGRVSLNPPEASECFRGGDGVRKWPRIEFRFWKEDHATPPTEGETHMLDTAFIRARSSGLRVFHVKRPIECKTASEKDMERQPIIGVRRPDGSLRMRHTTARESAVRLQSFPFNFTLPENESTALMHIGNSINVKVLLAMLRLLLGLPEVVRAPPTRRAPRSRGPRSKSPVQRAKSKTPVMAPI